MTSSVQKALEMPNVPLADGCHNSKDLLMTYDLRIRHQNRIQKLLLGITICFRCKSQIIISLDFLFVMTEMTK